MVKDIYEIKDCPDCGSSEIIHNEKKQHVVCRECNVIYEPLTPKEEDTYLHHKPGSKVEVKHEIKSKSSELASKLKSEPKSKAGKKTRAAEPKIKRRRPRDDDGYI